VASVAQLDRLARTVTWSKFQDTDFEFVNKRPISITSNATCSCERKLAGASEATIRSAATGKTGTCGLRTGRNHRDQLPPLQEQTYRVTGPEPAAEGSATQAQTRILSHYQARSDPTEGHRVQGCRLPL
jgi:hypothetical protein